MKKKPPLPARMFLIVFACLIMASQSKQTINPVSSAYPSSSPPDSLYYYYNEIRSEGLSARETPYTISVKYPVALNVHESKRQLFNDYINEIVNSKLGGHLSDKDRVDSKYDHTALIDAVMQAWLTDDYTNQIICMEDSITIEVVLNSDVLTLKTSHWGYWGGAHGDYTEEYLMLDKDLMPIDQSAIIDPQKLSRFNILLSSEFDHTNHTFRTYTQQQITNPDEYALTRDGLIVVYYGSCTAEGNPQTLIKSEKIADLLASPYREVFRAQQSKSKYR